MPHFQDQIGSLTGAADRAQATHAEKQLIAVDEATQRYEDARDDVVDLTSEQAQF